MGRLEDLRPGAWVAGVVDARQVRVVRVEWAGRDALVLSWEDDSGDTGNNLLDRDHEEVLSIESESTDGDTNDGTINVDRYLHDMRVDVVRVIEKPDYSQWLFRDRDHDDVTATGWVTIHDDGYAGLTFLGPPVRGAQHEVNRLLRGLPPPVTGGRFELIDDGRMGERVRLVHRFPAEMFAFDPELLGSLFGVAQMSIPQPSFLEENPLRGAKAYNDLVATLVSNGLAVPPLPDGKRLWWLGSWSWGTVIVPTVAMYMFDVRPIIDWWDRRPAMALCHEGHGINSYGLNLFFADGPVACFVQYGWGGAYMDRHRAAGKIARGFSRIRALPLHDDGQKDARSRFLLLYSEFRGVAEIVDLESRQVVQTFDEEKFDSHLEREEALFSAAEELVGAS